MVQTSQAQLPGYRWEAIAKHAQGAPFGGYDPTVPLVIVWKSGGIAFTRAAWILMGQPTFIEMKADKFAQLLAFMPSASSVAGFRVTIAKHARGKTTLVESSYVLISTKALKNAGLVGDSTLKFKPVAYGTTLLVDLKAPLLVDKAI